MTDEQLTILKDLSARYKKTGDNGKAVSINYAIVLLLKEKNRAKKAEKRAAERMWTANQPH